MANYSGTYVAQCPDDITFRAWGRSMSSALAALAPNVVQVYSTADWGTVGAEGSTVRIAPETRVAYTVYRLASTSEQTAAPVYFQISYYSGSSNNPSEPYQTVKLGTSYSGSGELTQISGSSAAYIESYASATSGAAGGARDIHASSDGHGLAFAIGMNAASPYRSGVLIIDRFRNPDGTPSVNGWVGYMSGQTSSQGPFNVIDSVSNTAASHTVRYPAIGFTQLSAATSTKNVGGESTVFPVWAANRHGTYTIKMALSYTTQDFPPTPGTFTATILGASRTYKRLGTSAMGGFDYTSSAGAACSIWWAG